MIAGAILLVMALFSVLSVSEDSATFDEVSHVPAGYSYITKWDMRLNFEHPPLIKDFAAIPLLFLNLNFPEKSIYWNRMVNTSFEFGEEFLYFTNNNADQILFFSRLMMIILTLAFGTFLFFIAKKIGGKLFGLTALILYAFSPEFLAHGRLVTTDVGATATIFIAFYFFLEFLKNSTLKKSIVSGLTFGLALLVKASTVVLAPIFLVLLLAYIYCSENRDSKKIKNTFLLLLLIFFVSFLLVGIVYQIHLINLPLDIQKQYTKLTLSHPLLKPFGDMKWLVNFCVWTSGNEVLRPYSLYLIGILAMSVKTFFGFGASGFPTYFFGKLSSEGWWYYFPTIYLIKIPLSFHILTIIALFCGIKNLLKKLKNFKSFLLENFSDFAMIFFVIVYFSVLMTGKMNLGIRHLLPALPFLYILTLKGVKNWINSSQKNRTAKIFIFCGLLLWYIISSVLVFPSFLTYFNELAGGPSGGSRYVTDSNLDWGQDLKRLKKWVDENNIEKIKIDYFGGGSPGYYFGDNYEGFDPKNGPQKGWLAISASALRQGQGEPTEEFSKITSMQAGYYNWLKKYKPVKVIGNSIFIYYIN